MLHLIPVTSTRITHYGRDERTAAVYVKFLNGECYRYRHVPASVWEDLQAAASKGGFIYDVLDHYDHGLADC